MNIVMMGSPAFAVPCLEKLHNLDNINISAVYSQPPKPKNRGMNMQDTEVAIFAKSNSLPLYTPKSLKSIEEIESLKAINPDLIVVAAYGLILPKEVLQIPKFGAINIHASLLPRWRGAAPIHHAILSGDDYTGITIMYMDEGLDTGNIIRTSNKIMIDEKTKFSDLHDIMAEKGADLIIEVIQDLKKNGYLHSTVQDDNAATYAHKITKEMYNLNVNQPSKLVIRQINALSACKFNYLGEDIKILDAEISEEKGPYTIQTADGFITPKLLQRPGKRPVTLKDFLNGIRSS